MNSGFRVVPKMPCSWLIEIYIVAKTGDVRKVAVIEVPHDDQLNDNLELSQTVCAAINKRIKKSV